MYDPNHDVLLHDDEDHDQADDFFLCFGHCLVHRSHSVIESSSDGTSQEITGSFQCHNSKVGDIKLVFPAQIVCEMICSLTKKHSDNDN